MNDPSRKYVKNPRFDFIVNDLWMTILIWKIYWKSFNSIAIQRINKNFIKLTKLHNIGPNQRTDLIICVTRRRWHSPVVTWETGKKNLRWTRRNEIVRNMMRHQHLISGRFLSIEKKKPSAMGRSFRSRSWFMNSRKCFTAGIFPSAPIWSISRRFRPVLYNKWTTIRANNYGVRC